MAQDYDWRYLILDKYYIPSVSSDGVLSWTPTDPSMPAVDAANITGPEGKTGIRGPQGIPGIAGADGSVSFESLTEAQIQMLMGPEGDCGVYVGESAPADEDKLIWIDTDDEASDEIATKQYVDEAIVKNNSGGEVSLETYATKDYVEDYSYEMLSNYYNKQTVATMFKEYYTKAQVDKILSDWAAAQGVPSSEEVNY